MGTFSLAAPIYKGSGTESVAMAENCSVFQRVPRKQIMDVDARMNGMWDKEQQFRICQVLNCCTRYNNLRITPVPVLERDEF